jgi:hypothetical protein
MTRIGQDDALRAVEGEARNVDRADTEASVALLPLGEKEDGVADGSVQAIDNTSSLAELVHAGGNQLQVVLTGEGVSCSDGVIRVPLEFAQGGSTCRLVVSIAVNHE